MSEILLDKCPVCGSELDDIARIHPCPCGRVFCNNCHAEVDRKTLSFFQEID